MRLHDRLIVLGLLALLAAVITAMALLWRHDNAPGAQASAPSSWPAASQVARRAGQPTLMMFVHPRCPCTRAALAELRTAMSSFDGRVAAYVLIARPVGAPRDWARGELWQAAASIPGVAVAEDPGQREGALFGAQTSGHVVLYGADGALLFQGGITGGRGHTGDNDGRLALVARLEPTRLGLARAPVFGCGLVEATP